MTVYVDDMKADFKPTHAGARGRTYVMSHMIADTEAELHAMADKIGVLRKWYQGDHYDITQSKKVLAVKAGAVAIGVRELSCMCVLRRMGVDNDKPLCAPGEAIEKLMGVREAKRATA